MPRFHRVSPVSTELPVALLRSYLPEPRYNRERFLKQLSGVEWPESRAFRFITKVDNGMVLAYLKLHRNVSRKTLMFHPLAGGRRLENPPQPVPGVMLRVKVAPSSASSSASPRLCVIPRPQLMNWPRRRGDAEEDAENSKHAMDRCDQR